MTTSSGKKENISGRRQVKIRLATQLAAAALLNGYIAGFAKGQIFTGKTKKICVPVLNCYSCPGALGSCPVGALQTILSRRHARFPFYVLGTLMLFGIVFGRLLCGFICPFGLLQDLLYKIPVRKLSVKARIDRPARYIKYAVLLILCILLPLFATTSRPFFCEYICPAGTLEGGIPLLIKHPQLRALAGHLFTWKALLLLIFLIGSMLISRFFCRYFCPLGAFYALFNRFSIYQMRIDRDACSGCSACAGICPMDVTVESPECIRCGKCRAVCPKGAVSSGFELVNTGENAAKGVRR